MWNPYSFASPVIFKGQLIIRNLTVYNYVKNCRYFCHYDKTLKYEEYNSEKQSYLEIELGELVLKLIIYFFLTEWKRRDISQLRNLMILTLITFINQLKDLGLEVRH